MEVTGQLYAAIALSLGNVLTVPQWIGKGLERSKRRWELCGEYENRKCFYGESNHDFYLFSLLPLTILIELLRFSYTFDTAQ